MSARLAVATAVVAITAGGAASGAAPSRLLQKGLYDEGQMLYGNRIDATFRILGALRTDVVRANLYWGGKFGVAKRRPRNFRNPDERGTYDWGIYDRLVLYATQHRIKVVFSIYGTPAWANGGRGLNRPPTSFRDLQRFAYTAAFRYSGVYRRADGVVLPSVRHWLAWNEPNNPVFLTPQFRRVGGNWIIESARVYASICNSVYIGVKATLLANQKVGCGVTGPRGNNAPLSRRPSVSPIAFVRAMRQYGATSFDAYAHHPYYSGPANEPTRAPPHARGGSAITLGNIGTLDAELRRLYGPKRIWITEYGYQTNPPDNVFGVSWQTQARYMSQAYAIARAHPRIDMLIWFMLKDEPRLSGWQSGLFTVRGSRKPAYTVFQRIR